MFRFYLLKIYNVLKHVAHLIVDQQLKVKKCDTNDSLITSHHIHQHHRHLHHHKITGLTVLLKKIVQTRCRL